MPSTIHILETALLILAAFLIGCVAGYLARRFAVTAPAEPAVSAQPAEAAAPGPELVVAPTIAPIAKRPSPAQRLAAAGAGSAKPAAEMAPEATVVADPPRAERPQMRPARVAGHATSGREVLPPLKARPVAAAEATAEEAPGRTSDVGVAPSIPDVEPEPLAAPVRANEVPPIDEAAHIVAEVVREDIPVADGEAFPEAPLEPAAGEQLPPLVLDGAVPPTIDFEGDAEAEAMRAIEGSWTPRASASPKQPAPPPDLAPGEIEAAMRSARSAVESAAAAARAAVSGTVEVNDPVPAMEFDLPAESHPKPFLDTAAQSAVLEELDFEPERHPVGFGRPVALSAPRDGGGDSLRQIKGVTPELEQALNRLGIFHFDQVAQWDHKAVVWLDRHLSLRGRIGREKWIDQARVLSAGSAPAARSVKH